MTAKKVDDMAPKVEELNDSDLDKASGGFFDTGVSGAGIKKDKGFIATEDIWPKAGSKIETTKLEAEADDE